MSKRPSFAGIELVHVHLPVFGARAQRGVHFAEPRIIPTVDGDNMRAAALEFEGEPAVPGADIEGALAGQIGWNGELRDARLLRVEAVDALDQRSIRQFETMPPALFGEALMPVFYVGEGIGQPSPSRQPAPSRGWRSRDRSCRIPPPDRAP